MTTPADQTIGALRSTNDELVAVVRGLSDEQLTGPSGASEWTVAQVLSHLGSGAEITLAGLRGATGEAAAPAEGFNQSVWDRWDAMSPREQADGFLEHGADVVAAFEALTAEQRQNVQVDMGFLPAPLSVAGYAAMRLNEAAQHSWDVRVAVDPAATLGADAAEALAAHFAGELGFLLGFIGKADQLGAPATVAVAGTDYAIVVEPDSVSFATPVVDGTATFTGSLEAVVRLLGGRLAPRYTPAGTEVTGNVTLENLRKVFPGY